MRKSFRNRLFAVSAAAVSSFLLLSGFDSALTAQDVISKVQENATQITSVNAQTQAVADISLDVVQNGATTSIPISGNVDFTIQATTDPLAMYVGGIMTGDASALGLSSGNIRIDVYVVSNEDGTGSTYVYTEGLEDESDGWHAASVSSDEMQQVSDAINQVKSGDISSAVSSSGIDTQAIKDVVDRINGDAALASDAVSVNGTDCYEITETVTGDEIYSLLSEAISASESASSSDSSSSSSDLESYLSIIQMLSTSLQIDITEDVSVDTFQPVYAKADMAGSNFSTIAQLIGAAAFSSTDSDSTEAQPEVNLTVNALNMTVTYDQNPVTIEVPAEALTAPVSETELNLDVDLNTAS